MEQAKLINENRQLDIQLHDRADHAPSAEQYWVQNIHNFRGVECVLGANHLPLLPRDQRTRARRRRPIICERGVSGKIGRRKWGRGGEVGGRGCGEGVRATEKDRDGRAQDRWKELKQKEKEA